MGVPESEKAKKNPGLQNSVCVTIYLGANKPSFCVNVLYEKMPMVKTTCNECLYVLSDISEHMNIH